MVTKLFAVNYDDKYTKPVKIYRGEEAVYKFMAQMLKEVEDCKKIAAKRFNKPLAMHTPKQTLA